MDKNQLFENLKKNPKNIRFEKLCKTAEELGFIFRGGKGSHRIYIRAGINEMLNFQNVGGKAKPYQVKQFIKIIEKYNLMEEDDSDA
ncbi:MAG: type II toxin-antitoxin system HicA family toxin [ANME-2 cluster archaeon]|nr:type II toxin-antitoxin system HicA family toxin [ANME-2 cluster archaeon]